MLSGQPQELSTIMLGYLLIIISNIVVVMLNWKYAQSNYKLSSSDSINKLGYQQLTQESSSYQHQHNTFMYRNIVLLCLSIIVFTIFISDIPNRQLQYLPYTTLQFPLSQLVFLFSFTISAILCTNNININSTIINVVTLSYIVVSSLYTFLIIAANAHIHHGFNFIWRLSAIWIWQIGFYFGFSYFLFQTNNWIENEGSFKQVSDKQNQNYNKNQYYNQKHKIKHQSLMFTAIFIIAPILLCMVAYFLLLFNYPNSLSSLLQSHSQISKRQNYQINQLSKHQTIRSFNHLQIPSDQYFKLCRPQIRLSEFEDLAKFNHFFTNYNKSILDNPSFNIIETAYWLILSCLAGILLYFLFSKIFHGLKQFHSHQVELEIRQQKQKQSIQTAKIIQKHIRKQKNIKYLMVIIAFGIVCSRWSAQYVS